MEYSALGTVEATDGGGSGPYHSLEEREGREPDGVRFDRERARRLWEAVSGAQPVGREEVEHMIQKNQCLFTNTQCKVCCALLISESQKLAHYQSKKHANKVKRYLAIHGMETLKGETKKLDSDQKSSRSKDKNQCCPICNMTFSSPVVAQSHYLGKTHAKNLKLKQQSTKVEALHQNRDIIDPDKFCSLCHATFNDPVMAQQHYVGKKHRKQETKLKLMAHYGRLADPAVADSSAGKGYPCKTCKIVLNSIEQYQAHVSGFKHKNQYQQPLFKVMLRGRAMIQTEVSLAPLCSSKDISLRSSGGTMRIGPQLGGTHSEGRWMMRKLSFRQASLMMDSASLIEPNELKVVETQYWIQKCPWSTPFCLESPIPHCCRSSSLFVGLQKQ
ncbi:zinc finger protein 346 isoform X5 [Choloepus didactylus]|uniref:zinc finger protein 346 isoform X5 n=1 Tax=Choloepus didactylus TaxID=27675 RepID=UPI00189FAB61|nr:zinc finger protein 346 isoform X5 [Choloepus didactylus]